MADDQISGFPIVRRPILESTQFDVAYRTKERRGESTSNTTNTTFNASHINNLLILNPGVATVTVPVDALLVIPVFSMFLVLNETGGSVAIAWSSGITFKAMNGANAVSIPNLETRTFWRRSATDWRLLA